MASRSASKCPRLDVLVVVLVGSVDIVVVVVPPSAKRKEEKNEQIDRFWRRAKVKMDTEEKDGDSADRSLNRSVWSANYEKNFWLAV